MTYRVFWAPHAELKLEALLGESAARPHIAAAARAVDAYLARNPLGFSESRFDAVRVGIELPLAFSTRSYKTREPSSFTMCG